VQTLYFCFPLNIKVVKIGQLCRTLGTPWMLVALESTSLQCGILSEKTGGFLTAITLAFTGIYTLRELFGLYFFVKSKAEDSKGLGACLAGDSIIFGDLSNISKPNAESFGVVLLGALVLGFTHWVKTQDIVLLFTTVVIIAFNITMSVKPVLRLLKQNGIKEIARDLPKLFWILALQHTHDNCINSS